MKILIIDNYDSFTYNLFQQIAAAGGCEPIVVHNDALDSKQLRSLSPDCLVLSPGPGRPEHGADFGLCMVALEQFDIPILGVCLGFQGIAWHMGGRVIHAPEPMHGRISRVTHDGQGLFRGIPQDFPVVRYHSLAVAQPLPDGLEATAVSDDGVLMGLRHRSRPMWGIQFHPESICTGFGDRIIANFLDMAGNGKARFVSFSGSEQEQLTRKPSQPAPREELAVSWRKLSTYEDPGRVHGALFDQSKQVFWLDSSLEKPGSARYSFMGDSSGPRSHMIRYHLKTDLLTVQTATETRKHHETIFDYLERQLKRYEIAAEHLPLPFCGGYVGWLGYELKELCSDQGHSNRHLSPWPDASFVFADRFIAWDHEEQSIYLVALGPEEEHLTWFRDTAAHLEHLPSENAAAPIGGAPEITLARARDQYLEDVANCMEQIRQGETYEICLTNRIRVRHNLEPLAVYRKLRELNPSPYAAFLKFDDIAAVCSSPERFLKIDDQRMVSSKPIKGTAPRKPGSDDVAMRKALAENLKDRAENLMIVDLVRNDLGRVCEVGSVRVPHLMEVESYATVHQLVSTIEGRLKTDKSAIDCIKAAFPGGSMTGAPKRRTMEIIDRLETRARGIYSGAIGYLGLDGRMDFNIVIRTIIMQGNEAVIGAGGAIVSLSQPEPEYDETILKARVLVEAMKQSAGK